MILNAIDPTAVRRERGRETEARASLALSPEDVVVGAVGRLEPQKDFAGLIAAFSTVARHVPRARLLIAGDGSLRANLQAQIDNLGLADRCRLLGQVDEVARLHHAFDLFVQSSVYEGTPNAILEAMAFESPIVATAAGGTTELVRDGVEALIVPCGDRAALTRALLTALSDFRQLAVGQRRPGVESKQSCHLTLVCGAWSESMTISRCGSSIAALRMRTSIRRARHPEGACERAGRSGRQPACVRLPHLSVDSRR